MAEITATLVKALRDETGLPMMECKTALVESNGDTEAAKLYLQKKYKGKMAARAANVTSEGRMGLFINKDRTAGAIVDLRCETAQVAKTDQFIDLADAVAEAVAGQDESAPAPQTAEGFPSARQPGKRVADDIADAFGVLRENLKLGTCRRITGAYLCGYVHHDGKSGVLVALDARPDPESVATDLCHHVAFSKPLAIEREGIPQAEVEKVRFIAREVAQSEGKPAQIIDKIVQGKVNAFYAESALVEQEHVKVSKTKVGEVLKKAGVGRVTDLACLQIV